MRDKLDTALTAPRTRSMGPLLPVRERRPWRPVAAALLVLCLAGAGIGGYLIGNSPEVDLDAVRSAAAADGREAGLEKGAETGYTQAYRTARKQPYAPVYAAAYKEAYAAEFESAGLDPPERIRVPRPR